MQKAIDIKLISKKNIFLLMAISLLFFITACSASDTDKTKDNNHMAELKVFKSPTCGCCSKWMDHMNASGFSTTSNDSQTLSLIKDKYGVPKNHRSCHTGVTEDGFVFEGHIPAKYIEQFLNQKPEGQLGLVVPGMPVGSPGMEYQDKFNPYTIMAFDKDGALTPFTEVLSYEQQFGSTANE
ncbi:DUF411 domain-containing protein [Marinicella sediminis]|uniref:DUF411 domain-containing protein n=1 Tax=Marinicella sediminis TaxID=1792834 RepID=A0ABV7J9B4_9GAMM|nr:DUF411 domain-containing protein [Marinicella sediminis]